MHVQVQNAKCRIIVQLPKVVAKTSHIMLQNNNHISISKAADAIMSCGLIPAGCLTTSITVTLQHSQGTELQTSNGLTVNRPLIFKHSLNKNIEKNVRHTKE